MVKIIITLLFLGGGVRKVESNECNQPFNNLSMRGL
jgi:hypothetical protein